MSQTTLLQGDARILLPPRSVPRQSQSRERSSNILGRAFRILELFTLSRPTIRIEDLIDHLGYARSTAYRYIGELCEAGLLSPGTGGVYTLGPRIIELERLLELSDPLYLAAARILPPLYRPDRVMLLKNLYRDKVICIHKCGPDGLEHEGRMHPIQCDLGIPRSLFAGAGPCVLVAAMSPARIRSVYPRSAEEIAAAGLGHDWETFRARMQAIRRRGYAVARAPHAPALVSIAVPVRLPVDRRTVGSLVEVFSCEQLEPSIERERLHGLHVVAQRLADEYARHGR